MKINKFLCKISGRFIPTLIILLFGCSSLYAQHVFSVSYDNLSRDNADKIRTEITTRSDVSVSAMSITRNRNDRDVYVFALSSVSDSRIVILNEENGRSVVITPVEGAPAQFELPPFFIEELRQAALGDAERFLVVETGTDFSVRSAASVSATSRDVFLPRYFYGQGEDAIEFLPKDRKIIHIFKERPRLISASDDPEHLRLLAELEDEMSYFVYMYQLSDGALIIFDEHFIPAAEQNQISATTTTTTSTGGNLQFDLLGLTGQGEEEARTATRHALSIWSARLAGTVPVRVNVTFQNNWYMDGVIAKSYPQPHFLFPGGDTWYNSALGRQLGNHSHNLYDIRIAMNSDVSWHYPVAGTIPNNHYDWITVMLHEVTHGLGFSSLIFYNTLQRNPQYPQHHGRFVYATSTGGYEFSDFPGAFDRQLFNSAGANLPNLSPFNRTLAVKSNNLFAGRPNSHLLAANGGTRVRMFAPNPFQPGSSVSHWDCSVTFPTFMKHDISTGFRQHIIDPREIAIMRDMGWIVPISLSGPDFVCASPSTFTVSDVPNGATVVWTSSAGLSNPNPGSGTSTSVSRTIGSTSLHEWVRATVTLSNGRIIPITKPVFTWVSGTQSDHVNAALLGPVPSLENSVFLHQPLGFGGMQGSNFYWTSSDWNIFIMMQGRHWTQYMYWSQPWGSYDITVSFTDVCGGSSVMSKIIDGGHSFQFIAYPNPATDILTVAQRDAHDPQARIAGNVELKLYNSCGLLVRSQTMGMMTRQTTINTAGLPEGNYFLHIIVDNRVVERQIIIVKP